MADEQQPKPTYSPAEAAIRRHLGSVLTPDSVERVMQVMKRTIEDTAREAGAIARREQRTEVTAADVEAAAAAAAASLVPAQVPRVDQRNQGGPKD